VFPFIVKNNKIKDYLAGKQVKFLKNPVQRSESNPGYLDDKTIALSKDPTLLV